MPRASTGRTSTAARRVPVATAAAVCLGLVFASGAGATVTIGAPDVSSNQGNFSTSGYVATVAQLTQPTYGVYLTAPGDGVITAWRVHGNAVQGYGGLALRVLRRDPNTGLFAGVATSDKMLASPDDTSPAHPVSIPVQAGDYIGVDVTDVQTGPKTQVFITLPADATFGQWDGGLPDGSTLAPSTQPGRLMLNAVESLRPTVSGVSPSSGSTAGGEAVTISGSGLDGATGVSFGGTPAASFTASATQITATAPAHVQGTVDVLVTGPGGVSPATGADLFSYVRPGVVPPAIVVVSPADGATYAQGQAVTAVYSCTAPAGTSVTSCAGPVANGAPIDTSTLGLHMFTVNAVDGDGGPATKSVSYTVVAAGTPIVSGVSETAKTWRENNALPHISAKNKVPVGTTFSFALNEPATVTLSFTRQAAGRKIHGTCAAQTKKNRGKPRCTRTILAGTLTFTGRPGTNKVRFAGRTSHTNKLKPGRYTLQITATNTPGKRSAPRSLTFTIAR
jgi:IPT/TIG domain